MRSWKYTIEDSADADALKAAFHRLARTYHPDKFKGDATYAKDHMQAINEAYDILVEKGPENRSYYDRTGHTTLPRSDRDAQSASSNAGSEWSNDGSSNESWHDSRSSRNFSDDS